MAIDRDAVREWHRLFGLLLTDLFTDSPFTVEVERDLSMQQQFLDVVILRSGGGRFDVKLPDGLAELATHNLITFKSFRETLDSWAMKELVAHHVAYRKLVSTSPSELLPEDQFRLYAVCARFPQKLSGQVAWHERQAGVYDCQWATDTVRVIVAGELPREPHNAPLHLFSASAEAVEFGSEIYKPRSDLTSGLLGQLFDRLAREGFGMPYTMADFNRDYIKEHFTRLSPEERRDLLNSLPTRERRDVLQSLPTRDRRELLQSLPPQDRRDVLQSLPLEERLAGLSTEQIQEYLEKLPAERPAKARKPRRKK
jgi:hypothetical protein